MEAEGGAAPSLVVNNEEEYDRSESVLELPPGFRFHPTDEEIIVCYLLNKVTDKKFAALAIGEIDLNNCEPWDLPKMAKMGEKEWWFFFQKYRKYQTGMRTNRATESGYWKATGKDKEIHKGKNCLIGMKKTLVFYKGRAPKGEKTNWVMHEYRLEGDFSNYNFSRDAKEEWVVCRVFHKKGGVITSPCEELTRADSFVDHLLRSPTLPPLTDDPCPGERPSSGFATEKHHEFNASISSSKLMLDNNQSKMLQNDEKNFFSPPLTVSTYSHQYPSTNNKNPTPMFSPQIVDPNSVFPHQSPPLLYQHQDELNSTIVRYPTNFPINGADQPNSRIHAPNIYVGGQEPERMCKMESFSLNNSIISHSQDTGMATEITSAHSKGDIESNEPSDQEIEGLVFSPSISELEYSLWN